MDLQSIPINVQEHIQSYLYFSYPVAKHIRIVNYIIENYVSFLMDELKYVFHTRVATLYFRMMKFLYKNHVIYEKVKKNIHTHVEPLEDYGTHVIYEHIENILNSMNIVENQRAYNEIMFGITL
tara:strand:- start:203 stop:574 length:372 start_codon:yes stop_codon:yes gene_type:complete